ncbi:MAG: hypothetical protein EPO40_16145 [Myxococcaceae bacterium]|nr:MAG: hypothetical protein EPO40_16145 [Myxococcaceae bacterium]
MTTWRDRLPPVSAEEMASLPPSVRARLETVEDLLDVTLAHVEELNRLRGLLEERVARLEERVGTNSSNSSKPPSSNPAGTDEFPMRQRRRLGCGRLATHRAIRTSRATLRASGIAACLNSDSVQSWASMRVSMTHHGPRGNREHSRRK